MLFLIASIAVGLGRCQTANRGTFYANKHSNKICVICGENVAGKPRTKDKQGRYYCDAS